MGTGLNARMERTWDVLTIHVVIWPCGHLDVERLIDACLAVVRTAHPRSYVARQVERVATASATTVDDVVRRRRAEFVRVVECASREEFVDLVCPRTHDRAGLPFVCTVTDGGLGVSYSHELGDGHVMHGLVRALLSAYDAGSTAVPAHTRVVGDHELLSSLGAAFLRRPSSVPGTVSSVLRRARGGLSAASGRSGRVVEPVRREVVVVSADELAAVDRWRRDLPSAPSSAVALLWLVARALREHGYPDPQPWQIMVNLRGLSGRDWSAVGGNLVGRVMFDVEGGTTPGALVDRIRDQTRGPGLLAQHVLKLGRTFVQLVGRRVRGPRPPAPSEAPSPGLSWSDLGRHAVQEYASLIPDVAADGTRVRPEMPVFTYPYEQGIGIVANWMNGGVVLSIAFGASPLDDTAVDGLLATLRAGVSRLVPGEAVRRG